MKLPIALLVALSGFSAGCSLQGMEVVQDGNANLSRVYTPTNLTQAVRTAANRLVMRMPSQSEYDEASSGVDGYTNVINRYLNDRRFASPQIQGDPDPDIAQQGG